jgi:predicted dehydrogenase
LTAQEASRTNGGNPLDGLSTAGMISVGLIGCGSWGPHLLRNLAQSAAFRLEGVADHHAERLVAASRSYPKLRTYDTASALIARPEVDAVVVATPASTHYELTREALQAGKHVLVEKPLSTRAEQAEALVALARRMGRVLMVDHTTLFTGSGRAILDMQAAGALGQVTHYDAVRANLGRFLPDVNVLWDLGPHDFSLIDALFADEPDSVEAVGTAHLEPLRHDLVHVTLRYPAGRIAHVHLSWVSPAKLRRTVIGTSDKVLLLDDLAENGKLKVFPYGIAPMAAIDGLPALPSLRVGECREPPLATTEPLARVIEHFAKVIAGTEAPIADGLRGLRVVRMLERAQAALDRVAAPAD